MKAIVLFLLFTSFLPAKTWIELAKEADYHLDHPGRRITEPEDDPRRLEYLQHNVETVTKILGGDPALLPVDVTGPEKESPTGDLMMSLVNLSQLARIRARRQEWSQVNNLFDLTLKARSRILASEPSLIWFLIAIAPANTAFQCLEEITKVDDRKKREAIFSLLQHRWTQHRATPTDFLITEKGELRFAREMSRDFKKTLRSLHPNLDRPPLLWSEDFPHQLTVREILELPIDHEEFRKVTLKDLKEEYQWIRNETSLNVIQKSFKKRAPRDLAFYRNHANGLGELVHDASPPLQTIAMTRNIPRRDCLQHISWHWLSLERNNRNVTTARQLVDELSPLLRKNVQDFEIKIQLKGRLITAPKENSLAISAQHQVTVPNLFPN